MTEEEKEVTDLFHAGMRERGVPRWSYRVNIERHHPLMALRGEIRVAVIRGGFAQTAELNFAIAEESWTRGPRRFHVSHAVDQIIQYIEKENA